MDSKLVRTKIILLDDMEIRIAALTMDQTEEYLTPLDKELTGESFVEAHKMKAQTMICYALNSAAIKYPEANGGGVWDPARLRASFSFPDMYFIQSEILKFSGLADEKKDDAKGGEKAADSTLGKSELVLPPPPDGGSTK